MAARARAKPKAVEAVAAAPAAVARSSKIGKKSIAIIKSNSGGKRGGNGQGGGAKRDPHSLEKAVSRRFFVRNGARRVSKEIPSGMSKVAENTVDELTRISIELAVLNGLQTIKGRHMARAQKVKKINIY